MLTEVINNPAIEPYMVSFREGEVLCYEGDESQDLYMLISGRLGILKGDKKISEVEESGSSLGEISFLLDTKRTATVKAMSDGKVLRIPKDKVNRFIKDFPALAWEIPRVLAERLDRRSEAFYALSEICDDLPDAVLAADREGNILSWNKAAERLFGRTWHEMRHARNEELYEETEDFERVMETLHAQHSVKETILKIRHPEKGVRFISTSSSLLFDGHHNIKGSLSLSRDVTEHLKLRKRYRRVRLWVLPSLILFMLMSVGLFAGYPRFLGRAQIINVKQKTLRDQIQKDHILLKSMLGDAFAKRDINRAEKVILEFHDIQKENPPPYSGIILLDQDRKVFGAFDHDGKNEALLFSSYTGISFKECDKLPHRLLTVYRAAPERPMGEKGIEIAFEWKDEEKFLGWLLFQMDMERLKNDFEADETVLCR